MLSKKVIGLSFSRNQIVKRNHNSQLMISFISNKETQSTYQKVDVGCSRISNITFLLMHDISFIIFLFIHCHPFANENLQKWFFFCLIFILVSDKSTTWALVKWMCEKLCDKNQSRDIHVVSVWGTLLIFFLYLDFMWCFKSADFIFCVARRWVALWCGWRDLTWKDILRNW